MYLPAIAIRFETIVFLLDVFSDGFSQCRVPANIKQIGVLSGISQNQII